jgi:hydroxymethylglutaryl-CoA synthase
MIQPHVVAIHGVSVGVPAWRLAANDIATAWGGQGGRGRVAVCGPDEDTLTLAWAACDTLLAETGVRPEDVDGLWWGTTRPPFAEGPSWVHLAASVRLGPAAGGAVTAGSPHAGVEALLAAADAIAAGSVERAIVVTSDALLPGTGTSLEPLCGAAATAVLLGRDDGNGPAVLGPRVSRWMPALDRYRGDHEDTTRDVYDPRLFREEVFLPLASEAATALGAGSRWSLPDPDGRLGSALAKRIGTDQVVSADVRKALGDTGAAAALTGLVPALTEPGAAALLAFGGGRATAVAVEVRSTVPGAERAAADLAAEGTAATYPQVLRARGQLEPAGEHVEMAVPPGSAMFVRGNAEILGLIGGRCVDCATINFPPAIHPACLGCGGDKFDPVPLSRTGTVQTFVINHAMPAPFVAPLPLVCVDLDDGSRVMFQGEGTGAELSIGSPVDLVLRRYAIERGVPVYGWKVRST